MTWNLSAMTHLFSAIYRHSFLVPASHTQLAAQQTKTSRSAYSQLLCPKKQSSNLHTLKSLKSIRDKEKKNILQSTSLPWWQICFQYCPGRCLSSVGRSVLARFKSIWKPFHVESSIVFNLLPYKKVIGRQKKVPGNLSYCASRSITIRRVNKRGHKCASFGKANEMKAIKRSSKMANT